MRFFVGAALSFRAAGARDQGGTETFGTLLTFPPMSGNHSRQISRAPLAHAQKNERGYRSSPTRGGTEGISGRSPEQSMLIVEARANHAAFEA